MLTVFAIQPHLKHKFLSFSNFFFLFLFFLRTLPACQAAASTCLNSVGMGRNVCKVTHGWSQVLATPWECYPWIIVPASPENRISFCFVWFCSYIAMSGLESMIMVYFCLCQNQHGHNPFSLYSICWQKQPFQLIRASQGIL